MKLIIHFQNTKVEPLNFGNGLVVLSHTLPGMLLLIHAEINVNP